MKKSIVAVFTLSLVFLYAFSTNEANAAIGNQEIEKSFVFDCSAKSPFPNIEPIINPHEIYYSFSAPEWVGPGEEFYLQNVQPTFTYPGFDNPSDVTVSIDIEEPNFRIDSENASNTAQVFLDDTEMVIPPYHVGTVFVPLAPESGVEVGPFIAGEEGQVTLKASQVILNMYILGPTLPITYTCVVPDDQEFVLTTINIDSEAPVITLNGENPMIVKQGDPYVEPGATAVDNLDGKLSSDDIEISGDVDTSTIGTYTVTYTISDSLGNVATVERIVEVVEPFGHWLTGEGPPSDEIGINGDSYLDITTGDVYKRDPNTWTKVGNIKGSDGKQGSAIHTGSGAPTASLGDVGDLYLDTNTGDVYEKTADGWTKIANLQGPAGPQGPKGADGTGVSGSDGKGSGKKSGSGSSKVTAKDDSGKKGSSGKGGKLPKTATNLPTLLIVGALLTIAGGMFIIKRRKAIE